MADFQVFSLGDAFAKAQGMRAVQQQDQLRERLAGMSGPDGGIDVTRAAQEMLKADPSYHTLAAYASLAKAQKEGKGVGGATMDERFMNTVMTYKAKKDSGVPTTPMEDMQARMAYEHLTQPKMGMDGTIMQPRYSAGAVFEQPSQEAPLPSRRSPYGQTPFSPTPRAVVTPGSKPVELLNKDVNDLSDTIQKNKLPQVAASIKDLNSTLDRFSPQNVPGLGYAKNFAASNVFLSKDGKAVKQKVQAVANDLLNMYSGLAVTLPEDERRSLEMMRSGAFSGEDFYAAWPTVINRMNNITGNIKAGVAPEVLDVYSRRPGAMSFEPFTASKGKATSKSYSNMSNDEFLKSRPGGR